jgi:uncharacterized protein YecE (DUF72 family)
MSDLFSTQESIASDGIRVGIGGWNFAPWRDNFYPADLVQRRELEYASRQVTAIEINSTYYGTQKPATYAKWRDETPEDFMFSAKAPKRIMQARSLTGAKAQIEDFIGGISELGSKLGPLVWQFEKGRKIDRDDLAGFLQSLPRKHGRHHLRHALELRDPTIIDGELLALARHHDVATVFTDSHEHPSFADLTSNFVYARLMRSRPIDTGYPGPELDQWAKRAAEWAAGGDPQDLPHIGPRAPSSKREVFIYFISSAKERNPAAAMALLQRLDRN